MSSKSLGTALHWYQKKLGSYDQQSWERSIEERVYSMKGLSHARPKGLARIKTELIDLDLIRGSAFTKAKPQQGFIATTYLGIIRVLLFPFYLKWWSNQTNSVVCALLFLLWTLQLSSMYIYFNYHQLVKDLASTEDGDGNKDKPMNVTSSSSLPASGNTEFDEIPASEVFVPVVMFVILSVIQSNIAASHSLDERNRRNHPGNSSTSNRTRTRSQLDVDLDMNISRARTASIRLGSASASKRNSVSGQNSCSAIKRRKRRSPEKKMKEVRIQEQLSSSSGHQENILPAVVVPNVVGVVEKKPSDEESGLEILESSTDNNSNVPNTSLRHRRGHVKSIQVEKSPSFGDFKPVVEVPNEVSNDENSSPNHRSPNSNSNNNSSPRRTSSPSVPSPPSATEEDGGDEGDHEHTSEDGEDGHVDDMSSIDEMSPYSTINSVADHPWYGDIVNQRFRSASMSNTCRRYSNSMMDSGRKRSGTLMRSSSGNQQTMNQMQKMSATRKQQKMILQQKSMGGGAKGGTVETHSSCCEDENEDSEGSMSPTTPNKGVTTDMEWPMINSEGTSEDEDDDDVPLASPPVSVTCPQSTASLLASGVVAPESVGRTSSVNNNSLDMDFASPPTFYYPPDDPDSLPPTIFSFCDDWMLGSRNCDKKNNDKGMTRNSNSAVSCVVWQQNECQKVDLTVLDISSSIIRKVGKAKHSNEYFYLALLFSLILAFIPGIFRLQYGSSSTNGGIQTDGSGDKESGPSKIFGPMNEVKSDYQSSSSFMMDNNLLTNFPQNIPFPEVTLLIESMVAPSSSWLIRHLIIVAMIQRFCLNLCFFFLLCVAERTYKERFMFSKYFCHLTSARRARRSDLPHFRLNKVRNIKTWLSVRSYLKKHGPQRSVDIIVSCGFILSVVILTFLCIQLLRESSCSSNLYCWEMVSWNLAIGIFIMRLIVLGSKMNRKYKGNLSVLITEQINLYLQLESKPHKKEELTLANHVLKLAADLLKQLEAPFKISGFSANHYLYNITKVVVLSAFSAVLTEMLGFKLKLHKIKL